MADKPLDVDSYRGMAAQKATAIRRALAEVETQEPVFPESGRPA